ncbi:MAG: hypothetical protein ACP5HG_14440 [Anaerolineae bacterium]
MRLGKAVVGVLVSLCLLAVPLHHVETAPLRQDPVVEITYPTGSSTISGEVTIQGTATYPNFTSYDVFYAPGTSVTGDTDWRYDDPIARTVQSMVVNSTLGTWDTTTVPNGQYVLALVVWEAGNDTPHLYFVNNLTVQNEEATPTPEPTQTPEAEELEVEPTLDAGEPPPAPTIQQPPTATPRPTATVSPVGVGEEDGNADDEGGLLSGDIFSMDAIKEAFVLGAQLAFLLYAVGILYVLAKAVIRYYLRQTRSRQSS